MYVPRGAAVASHRLHDYRGGERKREAVQLEAMRREEVIQRDYEARLVVLEQRRQATRREVAKQEREPVQAGSGLL